MRSRRGWSTLRTLPVFFGALELLLSAGVTIVAEAAFQDQVWRPRMEPLRSLAQLRIVHCMVGAEVAFARNLRRGQENPHRSAHADPSPNDAAEQSRRHHAFSRVSIAVPWLEVDTTDGYRPGLSQVVAFVNDQHAPVSGLPVRLAPG
jgi:hypothetical protein